jgi:DNA-binding LacI/PurR family transcriptional regulator
MARVKSKTRLKKKLASVPTVKEVAARAGVSTASVSRALSGAPGVHESTRARIMKVAQELSYRPNRAARDLRVRHSRTIGVLIPDIENPFFTRLVCGTEDALRNTAYSLLLATYNEEPEQEERRLELFRADGVCGLIFAASRTPSRLYRDLAADGISLVAVSRDVRGIAADRVTVANQEGAYDAVSHLIRQGHRRIAMINGPSALTTAQERALGFERAMRDANLPIPGNMMRSTEFNHSAGYAAMRQLLLSPAPPTAVFTASNLLTLGALQAIHELHRAIPKEIAIVGFDEMPWAMSLRPPLTTIAQPSFEVGRTAANLLLDRLRDPTLPLRRVVLDTRLIVRSSCGSKDRASS